MRRPENSEQRLVFLPPFVLPRRRPPSYALTRIGAIAYSRRMAEFNTTVTDLRDISARLDRLLELCSKLSEENRSLRLSQEQLTTERANLLAKNEQARSRVEAMITRLKSLEQNG